MFSSGHGIVTQLFMNLLALMLSRVTQNGFSLFYQLIGILGNYIRIVLLVMIYSRVFSSSSSTTLIQCRLYSLGKNDILTSDKYC